MCKGHEIRHELYDKIKDAVHSYGTITDIPLGRMPGCHIKGHSSPWHDKSEALNDYMFSVAVENCSVPNYFTEKIGDCFATGTIPVYVGCSNIGEFFNTDGIIQLTYGVEMESLTEELYLSKLDAVKDNFERIKKYEIPEDWMYETYQEYFN